MSVTLASRIEGQGKPLLLMHGLFGSARNWQSVQRTQAKNYQVHALDLRNHGASDWADTMSYQEMAADVFSYMDQHGMARAVILGHSMGGKVAMTMALSAPQRIDALVIVDIAPVNYESTLRPYLQAMQRVDLSAIRSRHDVDAILVDAVPDAGVRGFLLQNLVSTKTEAKSPGAAWRWRINLTAIDNAMDALGGFDTNIESPGAISYPVLGVYGEQSEYMRAPARAALAQRFPAARLVGIGNAGHWVHAEQPTAFIEALTGFMATLSSDAH